MENIIKFIEGNVDKIIANIDLESVDVYNFLKEQFENSNVNENHLFQFVYRSFYRLDNAGLTPEFKTEYFKILQENRNNYLFDFESVLKRLFLFPNRKGQNSFQFSFTTKMLNTINNKMPIYDKEVANMFNLSRPVTSDFDRKLNIFLEHINIIQKSYSLIIEKNLIPIAFSEFDKKFKKHNLHQMKKMDFIFWSAGKIKN